MTSLVEVQTHPHFLSKRILLMSGHNPFLVESEDDDDEDHEQEEENLLRTAAARANVSNTSNPEMMSYAFSTTTTTGVNGGGEGEASNPMKTSSSSSSSVFATKSSRESVPPLPSAPRMTTRSSGSTTTTHNTNTNTGGGGGFWIFSFKYYQKYFDVDTADVLRRIKKGTYGALGGALFLDDVKEKPDLYGAFWGCATLVFVVAMGGNFAEYLESMSSSSSTSSSRKRMLMMRKLLQEEEENVSPPPAPYSPPPATTPVVSAKEPWQFDVTKVSQCAAMTYAYVFLFPLSLYLVKRCYAGVRSASYTALVCLYGYSIMSYIPASILCIFPVETLRWVAVMTACAVSSASLFRNVDALLKGESGNTKAMAIAKGMGVAIVGANVIFAVCLKELFFRF